MSNAPVCNVHGVPPIPAQVLVHMQPIPRATDLASALRAIQAITNNFNTLIRAQNVNNTTNLTSGKSGDFKEISSARTTKTVRVYNPDDKEQFVDVKQITGLVFLDGVTGRTLTWQQ